MINFNYIIFSINITNSKFLRSNWPIDTSQKEPECTQFLIEDGQDIPKIMIKYDELGEPIYPETLPINYTYFPLNNSCPYINDFISNPDLPKMGKHESCKDYYMYRLTFKYFNEFIVNGT